jgi:hypothetical protein
MDWPKVSLSGKATYTKYKNSDLSDIIKDLGVWNLGAIDPNLQTCFLHRNPSCEVHQEPVTYTAIDPGLQDALQQCVNSRCNQRMESG